MRIKFLSDHDGQPTVTVVTGPVALDAQQALLLEKLRREGGAPVSYDELREEGIQFPASAVSELELVGVRLERNCPSRLTEPPCEQSLRDREQPVTDAPHSHQHRPVSPEPASQPDDLRFEAATRLTRRAIAPAVGSQLALREYATRLSGETGEQHVLARPQRQRHTRERDAARAEVDSQRSEPANRRRSGNGSLRASQQCPHAGAQLGRAQPVVEHAVGTAIEHTRDIATRGEQHEQRCCRLIAAQPGNRRALIGDHERRPPSPACRAERGTQRCEGELDAGALSAVRNHEQQLERAGWRPQPSSTSRGATPRPSRAISASVSL